MSVKSVCQMNDIVEILMELDERYQEITLYELHGYVHKALEDDEIYGEVRRILTNLDKDLDNKEIILFGIVASMICEYL